MRSTSSEAASRSALAVLGLAQVVGLVVATHAQWAEFDDGDVSTTIEFTVDFIAAHVEK